MCGLFLLFLSTLCLDAFSAVTVRYALNYSWQSITPRLNTSWYFSILDSVAHKHIFFSCYLVNFRVSFRHKISHENHNDKQSTDLPTCQGFLSCRKNIIYVKWLVCRTLAYRQHKHILYDIPPILSAFQVTQMNPRNSLITAEYRENI
jgi:hypothetical protein